MAKRYIVWKTLLKELPKNCLECDLCHCQLPVSKRDLSKVKEAYTKRRHKDCPLMEVEL